MQRVANGHRLVASEYVSYGHPDKIADQIADAILDEHLRQDENVRASWSIWKERGHDSMLPLNMVTMATRGLALKEGNGRKRTWWRK